VLVGLSGGPDSVSLALILQELASTGALPLRLRLAHLNHCLRGSESDADEEFCRRFAERAALRIEVARVPIREAAEAGESLEAAARRVRFAFLLRAARRQGLSVVALGHHADDVAETVLMRLLRGCGLRGLGALAPARPADGRAPALHIVRPLLELRKADLLEFLSARGEPWRLDSSNAQRQFERNRIRHELLPELERRCPSFERDGLCALNLAAVEANSLLDEMLEARWPRLCVEEGPDGVVLDASCYRSLPVPLRALAVRRAIRTVQPQRHYPPGLTHEHYEAAARLADRPVGTDLSVPGGLSARREHGVIYIRRGEPAATWAGVRLPVPGTVRFGDREVTISAEVLPAPPGGVASLIGRAGPREVFLALDAVELPLTVRVRRPGDRFHPLGAPGERKLKEFFINRKVPRHLRDRTPLVADGSGRIVWVVGHEIAEPARLSGAAPRVLHLRAKLACSR